MTKNLLSVSCLTNLKCRAEFDDQEVIIKSRTLILVEFWPEELGRVAFTRLLADPMKQRALLTNSDNLCELWHKRFGHLNYGSLPLLKDMVVGFLTSRWRRRSVQGMCTQTSMPRLLSQAVSTNQEGFLI
jgi:hypothetical protein